MLDLAGEAARARIAHAAARTADAEPDDTGILAVEHQRHDAVVGALERLPPMFGIPDLFDPGDRFRQQQILIGRAPAGLLHGGDFFRICRSGRPNEMLHGHELPPKVGAHLYDV